MPSSSPHLSSPHLAPSPTSLEPKAKEPHFSNTKAPLSENPSFDTKRYEQILKFLELFHQALETNSTQTALDHLIKDFLSLNAQDLAFICAIPPHAISHPHPLALLRQIALLMREKLYAMFSLGQICHTDYLYILVLFDTITNSTQSAHQSNQKQDDKSHVKNSESSLDSEQSSQKCAELSYLDFSFSESSSFALDKDPRFEPFIALAKSNLFAQHSSDGENALFITLYMLSKALSLPSSDFCLQSLMREYISLLCLLDINLPSSLEHSAFVVSHFQALNITPDTLMGAMKTQLDPQNFFAYPPIRRRSIFNWQLHCFWNVPHYFNHPLWLTLYPLWRELFYTLLLQESVESIDEAMYMQFFIYHICGNSFHKQQQWREFCEEIDKVAAKHYESFARKQGIYGVSESRQKCEKKTIGIVRDRLVANSPYKVEISLLTQLLANPVFSQKYEFKIYTMKLIEKSADDEAVIRAYEHLGIKVIDVVSPLNTQGFYNSHLGKALALKNAINTDGVEILISPNNGYGISDFLLASRSSSIQLYYSHGNFVYDLPCLDGRLTHICQNKRRIKHEGFDFYGVPVKMLECFYNPNVPSELIKSTHKELVLRYEISQDSVIIGTIGRLTKLNSPRYWRCVIQIMQQYPKSIYLACGGGNISFIQEVIEQSFRELYALDSENFSESSLENDIAAFMRRVCFVGYVDSAVYGHIIDVWLDSFPLEQGESRIEFAAKGGLSLMMSQVEKTLRFENIRKSLQIWGQIPHKNGTNKEASEIEEAFELIISSQLPLLAFSEEEYIQKGSELVGHFTRLKEGDLEKREYIATLRAKGARARAFGDEIKEHEGLCAFFDILDELNA